MLHTTELKSYVWPYWHYTAVEKVHCLCGVSYCLAIDQEKLQGSFLRVDVRTLIKFYVLLGKSPLECCKSLMEGLGTHVSSYATVSVCEYH